MADQIPQCPSCGKKWILGLDKNQTIRCLRDAGGCGSIFPASKISELYVTQKVQEIKRRPRQWWGTGPRPRM